MKRVTSQAIQETVMTWKGVSQEPHRFGGIEFRLGKRELGHLHGNRLLDIPFPLKIRDELVRSGRVHPHHVLPKSGWVSFYLKSEEDIHRALELLRLSYELARKRATHES
jgi:predicted DNA-binding protein (MmcQ/YjbR family)